MYLERGDLEAASQPHAGAPAQADTLLRRKISDHKGPRVSGQHWANVNNFVLRAESEVARAREEISNARSDSPFTAPTQKQLNSIFSSLRKLRSSVNELSREWKEAVSKEKGSS